MSMHLELAEWGVPFLGHCDLGLTSDPVKNKLFQNMAMLPKENDSEVK